MKILGYTLFQGVKMADINRKVLKSVSELSSFKFLLVLYLVIFVIWIIVIAIIGLLAWMGLASSGVHITDILQNFGLGYMGNMLPAGGSTLLYVISAIVGGLVASVIYAAFGTLMVWIGNVILRITGGIELRFIDREQAKKPVSEPDGESE